jgi:tetratricopeptide (TPR) repeat protein
VLAWLALSGENYHGAIDLAGRALALDDKLCIPYFVRANAYLQLNEPERALRDINRAIELHPLDTLENPESHYVLRAAILERLGQYEQAAQGYRIALKLNPTSFDAAKGLWSSYFNRGKDHIAYELAQELPRKWPKEVDAWGALALSAAAIGEMEAAGGAAKQAITIDPKATDAHYALAMVHLARDEYGDALRQCDQALELDPENLQALRGKILVLSSCPLAKCRDGRKAQELVGKLYQLTGKDDASSLLFLAAA